jgi:hypothetical protein
VPRDVQRVSLIQGDGCEDVLGLPREEVAIRHVPPIVGPTPCALRDDEPLGVRVAERPEQHCVDNAEDRGRQPDAEGERDNGDRREPWALAQCARAEPQILRERVEPSSCRHLPYLLQHARPAAEPSTRGEARLVASEPGVAQLHLLDLLMEAHLALELTLELASTKERAKAVA